MQLDDAEALLAVYGDVETMQHLNSELPATVDEAREWVQTKIDLFERDDQLSLWTVIHTESGQIVGDVGLQHEDYGSGPVVGIGGRGNRHFWRQGMGFEAASATIDAGFGQLELAVIGAETRPENRPAQALLSKLGMQPAGTNTDGWPVYLITREAWLARTRQNPVTRPPGLVPPSGPHPAA
jgi:ribosomal-protein-alanine N-acetyltransferase